MKNGSSLAQNSNSSRAVSVAPGFSWTNAFTSSSPSGLGTPTTTDSKTRGWRLIADSTSYGARFSPRRRITSFFRSTK